jgi:hypothetical protein
MIEFRSLSQITEITKQGFHLWGSWGQLDNFVHSAADNVGDFTYFCIGS